MSSMVEQISEMMKRVMRVFKKVFKPLFDWFKSPQTRKWMKHAIVTMRRAGVIQSCRRQVSTKRARIYQRKVGIML